MRITEHKLAGFTLVSITLAFAACDRGPDDALDRNAFADDGDAPSDETPPLAAEGGDGDDGAESQGEGGESSGDEGCADEGGGGEESGGHGYGCEPVETFDLDRLAQYVEGGDVVVQDCFAWGAPSGSWRAVMPGEEQLWVLGVYETRDDHSYGYHPMGAGSVSWSQPGDNVLVLAAYEPTTWTVEIAEGGELSRIIALGYHEQIVDAPEGVEIEIHSFEQDGLCEWACGYSLPGDGGGCEGEILVGMAEHLSGRTLTAFDGCYDASVFAF